MEPRDQGTRPGLSTSRCHDLGRQYPFLGYKGGTGKLERGNILRSSFWQEDFDRCLMDLGIVWLSSCAWQVPGHSGGTLDIALYRQVSLPLWEGRRGPSGSFDWIPQPVSVCGWNLRDTLPGALARASGHVC